MPNIAQQDYIIIDWEGKDSNERTSREAGPSRLCLRLS